MRFVFLFFLLVSALPVSAQSDDLILWEEGRKLTWQNFTEGTPSPGAAAQSTLSIHYTVCKRSIWNGKVALRVDCTFQKSTSLVSKQAIHPLLLGHEQLHFDIAEVFARKLRKEFSKSKLHTGNVDEEAKRLYHKVMLEYNNLQRMFDIETQYGTEKDTQLKWERRVEEELKRLENYRDNSCESIYQSSITTPGLLVFEFPNLPSPHFQIFKSSNLQISKFPHFQISKSSESFALKGYSV